MKAFNPFLQVQTLDAAFNRESGIWQEADSCAKITKFSGLNILSTKTAKYRHLLLLGPKISEFSLFPQSVPGHQQCFEQTQPIAHWLPNEQSVLPKDCFFFFLVTFLCNLAWQPVNKTFIKHYHIDAVLSWPTSLFLNIYIASFVPIVHSQSRFQIYIRVVLKSTWSCPRTVKKVSRS